MCYAAWGWCGFCGLKELVSPPNIFPTASFNLLTTMTRPCMHAPWRMHRARKQQGRGRLVDLRFSGPIVPPQQRAGRARGVQGTSRTWRGT